MVGTVFLSEGIQKFLFVDQLGAGRFAKIGLPSPQLLAPLVGGFEIVCGALLLVGFLTRLATVPLLIIDDLGMRKLPHTAAEDLLEVIMRRYERASTLLTSNRPVDDWGKLLGDTAAVTALLDRLLHHAHVLKCGPRSWRTKVHTDLRTEEASK